MIPFTPYFFLLPKRSSLLVCRCSSRSEETRCSFAVTVFLFSPTYFCPPPLSLPFPLTPPLRFKPARSRPFSHTTIRFSSCTYHHPYLSKAECGLICTLFLLPFPPTRSQQSPYILIHTSSVVLSFFIFYI